MVPRCRICAEPLSETERVAPEVCTLCAHRTTAVDRDLSRPVRAGVLDSA
jgi:hypothetical protein